MQRESRIPGLVPDVSGRTFDPRQAPVLKRILVPLDGSALADRILTCVWRILRRQDAEVKLLRVLPASGLRAPDRILPGEAEPPVQHIERIAAFLRGRGVRAGFDFMYGDPAEGILRYADDFEPSLVAMSTHGHTGLKRLVRGSVAERVLRRARHPLLLANPRGLDAEEGPAHEPFRRILAPLDGSEISSRVLPLVRDFAAIYGAEVVLLHVEAVQPPLGDIPWAPPAGNSAALLEPHRDYLARGGVSARVRTSLGFPTAGILSAVAAEKADLVAMATHGRSGIARWFHGSVAEEVLRRCPRPVLFERTAPSRVAAAAFGPASPG